MGAGEIIRMNATVQKNIREMSEKTAGQYKSLWEIAYNTIRHKILIGEYESNAPLVVSKLSEEMGMSIIPIREAMRHLENEGLVRVVPHKGVTVAEYDTRDIAQIYEVRKMLEARAAALAVPNVTAEVLEKLKFLLDRIKFSLETSDYNSYSEANNSFHETLYGCSENYWLCKTIFDLWGLTLRSMAAMKWSTRHRTRMVEDHQKMLDALRARKSAEFMERLVIEHLEAAKHGVIEYVEHSKPVLEKK